MAVELSRVGLGGYELEDVDVERAVAVLAAARSAGTDWVDTSEAYFDGGNETLIGDALQRAGPIAVSTKVAPDRGGFRPEQIHASCRASLDRLKVDHLDLYFLHYPDATGIPLEESWGAMAELADGGLVGQIGLSNYSLDDIARCHSQRSVDAIQDGLSMLDYLEHRHLFAEAAKLGVRGIVFEPLANGLLTGAIRPNTDLGSLWGGRLEQWAFYGRLFSPRRFERSLAVAEAAVALAERWNLTLAQVALAWCAQQPGVSCVLAGTANPTHARSNAHVTAVTLSTDQLGDLDALVPLGPSFLPD